jgi:hypothetical protein
MTNDSTNEQSSDNDSRASSNEQGIGVSRGVDKPDVHAEDTEKNESARDENVTEGREDFDGCGGERSGSVVSSHTAGREGSVVSSHTVGRSESPASSHKVGRSPAPIMSTPDGSPEYSREEADGTSNEDGSDDTESENEDSDEEDEEIFSRGAISRGVGERST